MAKKRKRLTEKQKKFCHYYVMELNGAKAARQAGFATRSASSIAHELLNKPEVKNYLEGIKEDYATTCGITITRQLNELAKIAYSNIADYHNSWISLEEFNALSSDQKAAISKTDIQTRTDLNGDEVSFIKIELHSKLQAIKQINEMLGFLSPEKKEVVKKTTKKMDFSKLTYEQLEELSRGDTKRG